jgi:hypothetical protein
VQPLSPRETARLDRAVQYSSDSRYQSRSRGVLDAPVKPGHDGGDWDDATCRAQTLTDKDDAAEFDSACASRWIICSIQL